MSLTVSVVLVWADDLQNELHELDVKAEVTVIFHQRHHLALKYLDVQNLGTNDIQSCQYDWGV